MRIDVLARMWGGPDGASNGMAIAASYFAHTLEQLGHQVRKLGEFPGDPGDLVVTTIQPTWKRTILRAQALGAVGRLVYWHHAGGVPNGRGGILAAPPSIPPQVGNEWVRQVVLAPSSWAADEGGERTGSEILVAGAGVAKGGHVALQVARRCPDLSWYVLQGRSAPSDRAPWGALPHAEVAQGVVPPAQFLARARAVLAPTRFDVHPLLLVEAAVRGIPIVCTDLPATRAAAGDSAIYVPMGADPDHWEAALRDALATPLPRLRLRPYREVVAEVIAQLAGEGRAAA